MSLILDALRKADAERERGSVPSLHSQPVVPPSTATSPESTVQLNWLWVAVGVAVGLLTAATWVISGRNVSAPSAVPSTVAPAQPSMLTPAPARPAVLSDPAPPANAAADIAAPAPWRQPSEGKTQRAEPKSDTQVRVLGNVPLGQTPIYSREQLPPEVRAALPQLAVSGSIYSQDSSARSLIVNGQLYREKARLTQELSLDEIKQRAAIFSFRGYRFEVLY
jgi:general secretion pathway protein B